MGNKKIFTIIGAIAFVVFNIVFFILKPEEMHSGGWISYVCIDIIFIVLAIWPWIEVGYSVQNLNVSTNTIALLYACAAIVAGAIFIAANPEGGKIAFVVHILIMAIFAVWMVVNVYANRKTADSVDMDYEDQLYIKRLTKKVKSLIAECESENIRKELNKLYDEVHASPVVAAWCNPGLEKQIEDRIDRLFQQGITLSEESLILEIRNIVMDLRKRNQG